MPLANSDGLGTSSVCLQTVCPGARSTANSRKVDAPWVVNSSASKTTSRQPSKSAGLTPLNWKTLPQTVPGGAVRAELVPSTSSASWTEARRSAVPDDTRLLLLLLHLCRSLTPPSGARPVGANACPASAFTATCGPTPLGDCLWVERCRRYRRST